MEWNQVQTKWKDLKGQVREKWGELTDDDVDKIAGRREQLEAKLQERYGYAKERAKKELDDFISRLH